MLIDRADGAINICEMKYAKDEFVIDATFLYEHIPGNEDVLLLKARVEKAQGMIPALSVRTARI